MVNNTSPLESLAAFAIAFAAGAISTIALNVYTSWVRNRDRQGSIWVIQSPVRSWLVCVTRIQVGTGSSFVSMRWQVKVGKYSGLNPFAAVTRMARPPIFLRRWPKKQVNSCAWGGDSHVFGTFFVLCRSDLPEHYANHPSVSGWFHWTWSLE